MLLTPGGRLGPYEIVAPLGAGGMGEVWRARDPRLGRDVAIKVLPDAFAADPERLARFEREARLLASLQHPNVAGIHGVEEANGHRCLVLEFVEGETLAARLARGPLPVDDAIDVCRQVAEGIEAAHEAGVVHRDLKPGNVMLKPDGTVKVLDFGLARSGAPDRTGSDPNLSASPTLTAAATTAGLILGTAGYMSPEQARGRAVDKRSDVWSFGCVLFECLTGRQAFRGETVSDTIASILRSEPDLASLPPDTPARVRQLLERCLAKDARVRLRDIGEARVLLSGAPGDAAGEAPAPVAARPGVPVWLAVAGAVGLATFAVVATMIARPREAAPVRRFALAATDLESSWISAPTPSPDGRMVAYVAQGRLWVRDLAQLEPRSIAEVSRSTAMCWAPDSKQLAYADSRKLWVAPVAGGAPASTCDLPETGASIGLSWSDRGQIAVSIWRGGLYTVPAGGGNPTLRLAAEPGRIVDFHWPTWLPNGELMYVVHWTGATAASASGHELEVLAGSRRYTVTGDWAGDINPILTPGGRLLFTKEGSNAGLWAAQYDAARHRIVGDPKLLVPNALWGKVSRDGMLLYVEGGGDAGPVELDWVDRTGKVLGSTGPAFEGLRSVALSPDRRRVAFLAGPDGSSDVWVRDLVRGTDTRITFSKDEKFAPAWLGPDRVMFAFRPDTSVSMSSWIVSVRADGSGDPRAVAPPAGSSMQMAFLGPGARVALRVIDDTGHGRLRRSTLQSDGTLGPPEPFVRFTPEPDIAGLGMGTTGTALSPEGGLVAYSNNDPLPQVFLTRFPGGEGPWQVSTEGGRSPRWAPEPGLLYFVAGSGVSQRWFAEAKIDVAQDPPVGRVTRLFDLTPFESMGGADHSYDVDTGGRRFLFLRRAPGATPRPSRMVLVENWEASLAK